MAYTMMAKMIAEGRAPGQYDETFQHMCELKALRLGDEEQLDAVVEAYKAGALTEYAAEIEQYYLPAYEEKHELDDMYDEEDDGRYDAWA